jgi:hypothetical protein
MNIFRRIAVVGLVFITFAAFKSPLAAQSASHFSTIMALQGGHMRTCAPAVSSQLKGMGYTSADSISQEYCRCLGVLYFGGLAKQDLDEMRRNNGALPDRIARDRSRMQEHCADIHLPHF